MFSFFSKPYPRNNDFKFRLRIVLLSGIFVSVILYFIFSFQGNAAVTPQLIFDVLLFGLVTIISTAIIHLLLPAVFTDFFKEENWTVGKNLLTWLLMLTIITIGNTLLAGYLYGYPVSWKLFWNFLYYTVGVGFFVYALFVMINYNRMVKKNKSEAKVMNAEINPPQANGEAAITGMQDNHENGMINLTSENGKEEIKFLLHELLYIESADNYSKIVLKRNNKVSVSMIRSSLKRIEEQAADAGIYRCHRAFMVNLKKVISVSGNSQGYRLHINDTDETIPVSRSYGKELSEKLKELSGR